MAVTRVTGTLTFANNTARNSAETALAAQLALTNAVAFAGTYPAGLVRGGTGVLTVSYESEDPNLVTGLIDTLLGSITGFPRSAGHLNVCRVEP